MKTARLLLAFTMWLAPVFAGYTYDYASMLNPYNAGYWAANGTYSVSTNMYTSTASMGGALILNTGHILPSPSNDYEVKTTLTLGTSGGTYISYLRASPGSLLSTGNTGVFYAIEIVNPTFSGGACSATLNFLKQTGTNQISTLTSTVVSCHSGMVVRTVFNQSNAIVVFIDNLFQTSYYDSSPIASGQPGVGVISAPSGNYISTIDIGHLDTVAPNPINPQLVGTSSFPTRVDIQFAGVQDDPNGTGVAYYQFWRNNDLLAFTTGPEFSDEAVVAGTSYSYLLQAVDFHGNVSQITITTQTAPAGAIDPREVGVRPTGTYWGGNGEQIDMRSGNLNFTIPLFTAMNRGGHGVGFNLSYNSQNWRQDPAGTWQLGRDVGYGYGWRLQAGSLTPIYHDYWTVDHYLFIDSTGAEYHLNVNTNGVWSSTESIYIYYDSNAEKLHFTDGSYWFFGCVSAGGEQDAGTMYPTDLNDSNGNHIILSYANGLGVTTSYSSSRIYEVEDVRGNGNVDYFFTYTTFIHDPIPHLTGITNNIGTAENYTLNYAQSQPLNSPFTPSIAYGKWTFLASVANNVPLTTSFTYDSSGSGELDQVTFPYGGHFRWAYGPFNYSGTRTLREVNGGRFLLMSTGATELTYGISFAPNVNTTFHPYSQVDDPDGNSEKAYGFGSTAGQAGFGILSELENRPHHYPNINGEQYHGYTWTTDSAGNAYISAHTTTEDNGLSTEITKQTNQTLDQYGNVTQTQVFNYGNLSTPMRTYTNTYLNSSAYTSLYILNRLVSSTVTDGTYTTTLANNTYDCCVLGAASGIQEHYSSFGTTYLTRGNVTTAVTPAGTTLFNYDIAGNVTLTNVNGVSTSNTLNTTTNYAAPSAITTNSLTSNMGWSGFLGLTSVAGPNGDTGSIVYDANARPHTTTSPLGAVTTYTYNDTATPPNKVATTNGHWVQTNMDGLGRTLETQTGNGTTIVSLVDSVYVPCGCSPVGKIGQVSQPHAFGGTIYWTIYTYDGLGRTTLAELPDGSWNRYSYAGNTVTMTDPAGVTKTFTLDGLGHLTQVQETDPSLGTVYTNYTYDILNHLIQVSMPRGSNTQTRSFNYVTGTSVGINLLSATNPENGTVTYTYYSNNMLHTKLDAKGNAFTYSYDGYNRLTQIMAGSTVLRTFMYDTNTLDSTFSGSYTQGRLVAVQHTAFTPQGYIPGNGGSNITVPSPMQFVEMYGYTQAGLTSGKRLQVQETLHWYVNQVQQQSNRTLNLDAAYAYDTEGKTTSVTYPSTYSWNGTQLVATAGPKYTYSFDAMDRPAGLKDQNSNTAVSGVQYNPANQLLAISYFGESETRSYNILNQMTSLGLGGSQGTITYTFPPGTNNGKISMQTNSMSGETVTYQYDSLNRLSSAISSQGWSETYGYDGFGNLLSKTGTGGAPMLSQSVNPATNQVVGQTYDANGNQMSGPLGTLGYDAENRIVTVSSAGVQYFYDSRNKRIWKSTLANGNLTQEVYFYGEDGQKLGTYAFALTLDNGTPQMTNSSTQLAVFFGSKRVGLTVSGSTGPFVPDRLGSAGSFYPYGEARGTPPSDQIGFATYTRDSATGLDYADQRYYANNWGRFMSTDRYQATPTAPSDPGSPQSWNRYSYVLGDPLNFYDPQGRKYCPPWSADAAGPGEYGCPDDDPCLEPDNPFCPEGGGGDGGGGGGGGGAGGGEDFAQIDQDISDARADLAKGPCFALLGFASAAAAQKWFDGLTFHFESYGDLSLQNGNPMQDPAPANTLGYGQININTDFNWQDFSKVPTQQGGTFNYLRYWNRLLHSNMSSEQLGTLIIIHELGHQATAPNQPSDKESVAEKKLIFEDCIK